MPSRTLMVLKIESYSGDETYLHCGPIETLGQLSIEEPGQEHHLYAIIAIENGHAEMLDCGYRTLEEALHYWPEALQSEGNSHAKQPSR